jgi:FkbM family methyltransferase
VSALSRGIAGWFLRYASPLSGLRRLPLIGPVLSWTSRRLVPRDTLTWIQVQRGPAQGMWLRVNPRTGHDVLEGLGEPAVQAALRQQLRPGMIFYDLGANIGFFSLLAARLVGPTGRVVSFEADPEVAERLRENVARNNLSHVVAEQKAVWSETRAVTFARVDAAASPDRGLGHVTAEAAQDGQADGFALSIDDYVVTNFVSGSVETFPMYIYGASKLGVPPQVYVMGTLIFTFGVLIAGTNLAISRRRAAR